jgi:hypothetical protein
MLDAMSKLLARLRAVAVGLGFSSWPGRRSR